MIEPALIIGRLMQYLGAMILFGSSLFFSYALPSDGNGLSVERRWARRLLISAAIILAVFSLLAIGLQASLFSGSFNDGFSIDAVSSVVSYMGLGKAALVRAVAAVLALILLMIAPSCRLTWLGSAFFGGIGAASLAWLGHGSATEGPLGWLHLTSDVVHALAAGVWLGALAGFALLTARSARSTQQNFVLHRTLHAFSSVGSIVVAALVLTGLVNGWVLVGPDRLAALPTTPYGRLLIVKMVLFAGMLGFAAMNRFKLTPTLGRALDQGTSPDVRAVRRSIVLESALGIGILLLVAWLGTLAPPASG